MINCRDSALRPSSKSKQAVRNIVVTKLSLFYLFGLADTENIRFVFAAVKDTILQLNLKEYNLVWCAAGDNNIGRAEAAAAKWAATLYIVKVSFIISLGVVATTQQQHPYHHPPPYHHHQHQYVLMRKTTNTITSSSSSTTNTTTVSRCGIIIVITSSLPQSWTTATMPTTLFTHSLQSLFIFICNMAAVCDGVIHL